MEKCKNPNCHKRPMWSQDGYCPGCYMDYLDKLREDKNTNAEIL